MSQAPWPNQFSSPIPARLGIKLFISVFPGFIPYESSGSGLLLQATRLGVVYVAIATAIHASIVLLASQLRPLLIAGTHEKTIGGYLPLPLCWSRRGSPGRRAERNKEHVDCAPYGLTCVKTERAPAVD